jgi:hypothetical protein
MKIFKYFPEDYNYNFSITQQKYDKGNLYLGNSRAEHPNREICKQTQVVSELLRHQQDRHDIKRKEREKR